MAVYSVRHAPRLSPTGLAVVVALHVLVFFVLVQVGAVRLPSAQPVLSVELLPPPAPDLPKSAIVPPRPRPMKPQPMPQAMPQPVSTTTQLALAAQAPVAVPVVEQPAVPPAPTFVETASPAPPAPLPTIQPRFDADYLDNPKPAYPALARRLGEEGRVVLRVQVAASGLPTDVTLHQSSGSERLDAAALTTVRRWKFVPARQGDEPVSASVLVPIVFSLKD